MSFTGKKELKRPRETSLSEEITVEYDFVVIGGGIAGVCCAQELARLYHPIEGSPIENHDRVRIGLVSSTQTLAEVKAMIDLKALPPNILNDSILCV